MKIRFLYFALVMILAGLWLGGCKHANDLDPNLPPMPFTVKYTLSANSTDVILIWNKAKDPNGDLVTYSVFYKDTLAKNLNDTTFTILNAGYNTTISGSIIAKDNHGASTSAVFTITVGSDPYVQIPDVNFEKALINLSIDDVLDGKL